MLGIDHRMDDSEAGGLEEIREFRAGSGEVRFAVQRREAWTEQQPLGF